MSDPRADEPQPENSAPPAEESDVNPAETQEERAMRALQAIWGGADLTEESMKLSNEYTDRHTARFTAWVRRVIGRRDS